MRLLLTERFQEDLGALRTEERSEAWKVILALPAAFREPARHTGLGLRKLHTHGIWEARVGLRLRLVFGLEKDYLIFRRVAEHDEVRRYLRGI